MKYIYFLALALLVSLTAFGQEPDTTQVEFPVDKTRVSEKEPIQLSKPGLDKSRIYYGGYVTMNFSKNYNVIGAQPLVGYKLTPKLSIGGQISYEYISDKRYSLDQNGSNYGLSIFNRYRVSPQLYGHTEFSVMSYKWFYSNKESERKVAPMFLVGGGYSQPVARNTWLNAQVLFDVLNHENSPYKDWEPYFSLGIGVGF